jgi:hypothetical protein
MSEGRMLYRGFTSEPQPVMSNWYLDAGRIPRNMDFANHETANNWFLKKFGRAFRSQAWLASGNYVTAQSFGKVYSIEPIDCNSCIVCWSPIVDDLFNELVRTQKIGKSMEMILEQAEYEVFEWNDLARRNEAIRSGNELMVIAASFHVTGAARPA